MGRQIPNDFGLNPPLPVDHRCPGWCGGTEALYWLAHRHALPGFTFTHKEPFRAPLSWIPADGYGF